MNINSTVNGELVIGSGFDDTIRVYGNHSTVNAMAGNDVVSLNGGRHDSGLWIEGDETNIVNAGDGNDSINVYSRGASIYGDAGNDTVTVNRDHVLANGGEGNDLLYLFGGYSSAIDNITVTGGDGNDTLEIYPRYNKNVGVVATDFSNDDVFRIDDIYFGISSRALNQTNVDGNIVIQDTSDEQPLSVTLQGVSDISQVANAKYYRYYEGTPQVSSTLGEIFGASSSSSTDTNQGGGSSSSESVTTSGGGNVIIINNYYYFVINSNNGVYTYNGGNKIINNYQQGEVVKLESDYQGIGLNGNSFLVNSSSGNLEIQNARDKFIGYSGSDGNVAVYSYVASSEGVVDGRAGSQAEIMIGAENSNNQIYAGGNGSSVWGGMGGNDTMFGGAGYDEFFFTQGSGSDVIQNAESNDVINLLGVDMNQITSLEVNPDRVNISFTDGGNLRVDGNSNVGFMLDGAVYACNQSTGEWFAKS